MYEYVGVYMYVYMNACIPTQQKETQNKMDQPVGALGLGIEHS